VVPDTPADAGTNSAARYGCGQLRQTAPQGSRAARSDALGQRDEYGTRAHGGDVRGEHPRACRAMLVTSDRQYLVADQLCAAEQGKQANRVRRTVGVQAAATATTTDSPSSNSTPVAFGKRPPAPPCAATARDADTAPAATPRMRAALR